MGFGKFTGRKNLRKQPPALEVVNTAMLPKTEEVIKQEAPFQEPIEAPIKRKRGRPKSAVNNDAHLHIKCPDHLMQAFKLLAVQERKTYPELLQKMMDAYEYVQDD